MTQAPLALSSRDVALELYALLREIDPARWRDELAHAARLRLAAIEERITRLLAATWPSPAAVRERLEETRALLRGRTPGDRTEWMRFREELTTAYEALAASLREWDVHVPSLRPTNYARNVVHVLGAVLALLLLEVVLPTPSALVTAAIGATAFVWTMEAMRRWWAPWNRLMMAIFGPIAHPHETHRVASSTWFVTAMLLLALTGRPLVGAAAVAVLGLGDPVAAVVGRRWGRHKLINGRTAEGSLAFLVAGSLAALGALLAWHDLSLAAAVTVAVAAALLGAVAELVTRRIDDNFAIPLAAGLGAWLAATWVL